MFLKTLTQISIFCLIFSALISCKKQVSEDSMNLKAENAVIEIRKIVGSNAIIVLNNNIAINEVQYSVDRVNPNFITIDQLKKIYSILNDKSQFIFESVHQINNQDGINVLRTNSIKSLSESTGPLAPGIYSAVFKGPTFLYSTSINFAIGAYGQVVGTPTITINSNYFYNPYTYTATFTSPITFNQLSSISQFTITGNLSMNLGVGSLTFTIISRDIQFNVTIDSDNGIVGLK